MKSLYAPDDYGRQSTHEHVFYEGEAAQENGDPRTACPYPVGNEWRNVWLSGWDSAE